MKTYRVTASYVSYCYADIEAENQQEAERIANDMCGGDFLPEKHGGDDWTIDSVVETGEVDDDESTNDCPRCRAEMSLTGTNLHWHCDVCGHSERVQAEEP